jgi:hypothetical protein
MSVGDGSDGALLDQLPHPADSGVKMELKADHQRLSGGIGAADHLSSLPGVDAQGLFTQNVSTCFHPGDGLRCVQLVWCGNDERIRLRSQRLSKVCINAQAARFRRSLLSRLAGRFTDLDLNVRPIPQKARMASAD